jgi:hypothetical protein
MKRLKLTAALLLLGMLTGCQYPIGDPRRDLTAAPSRNFNDTVASVNQQLWGTWEVKNEAGQSMLFIFTAQGQFFQLEQQSSQSYIATPFRYEVNSSYQPMHMDLVLSESEGERVRTIFEFTADGQLRLELANSNPDNRPSTFTSGGVLFTKISNTENLPPNTEVIDVIGQVNKARQVEARNNVGAMYRAQQAHYIEYDKFATNIQQLGTGIQPETDYYRYLVNPVGNSTQSVMMSAQAKRSGLKSYTGAVFAIQVNGETRTIAGICETNEPSMSPPGMPTFSRGEIQCPAGSRRL